MAAIASFGFAACEGSSGDQDSACVGPDCDDPNGGETFDPGVDPSSTACGEAKVNFEKRIPYVVLLVDQSGSMNSDFGNGTRWSVLNDALLNPQTGIVKRLEDEVRFGLALYTSDDGYAGGECPMMAQVETSFGNYSAIADVMGEASPFEDTPTGESILAVAEQLQKIYVADSTPKVIVLATDGEPDTCDEPDPQNGHEQSVDAARQAFMMGIQTYVVSVGDEIADDHLQDMANAGAGLPVNGNASADFYKALDQDQLYNAFDTIVNGVRGCVFTLDGEIVEGYEDQGTVLLNGDSLGKDDADGYKINNSKEIQLLGAACESIQEGDHELSIKFPCGGYEPPPIY